MDSGNTESPKAKSQKPKAKSQSPDFSGLVTSRFLGVQIFCTKSRFFCTKSKNFCTKSKYFCTKSKFSVRLSYHFTVQFCGSPNISVQSPNISVQSPNISVQSPNCCTNPGWVQIIWTLYKSKNDKLGSPNISVQSPNIPVQSPNISVQSPDSEVQITEELACPPPLPQPFAHQPFNGI